MEELLYSIRSSSRRADDSPAPLPVADHGMILPFLQLPQSDLSAVWVAQNAGEPFQMFVRVMVHGYNLHCGNNFEL